MDFVHSIDFTSLLKTTKKENNSRIYKPKIKPKFMNILEPCKNHGIKVAIMPEKKGLIYKHTEYEITTKTFEKTVIRRYSDFVVFYDLLTTRFPYRMVNCLPPKKIVGIDHEFIEIRRRGLKRFILGSLRHPIISRDCLVHFFLTYGEPDIQARLREDFKGQPDEYMSDEVAINSRENLSTDAASQFGNSRQHIRSLHSVVFRVKDCIERTAVRQTQYATDLLHLGHQLSSLSNDQSVVSTWATGDNTVWRQLRNNCRDLVADYAVVADVVRDQACNLENDVVEELNLFLDMLQSHQDLCYRHEKGVLQDHQKSLQKMAIYKKRHMTATVQGGSQDNRTEHLEQRMLKQGNEILSMENRAAYSLICAEEETRYLHSNLNCLHVSLCNMATQEVKAHSLFSEAWKVLEPKLCSVLNEN